MSAPLVRERDLYARGHSILGLAAYFAGGCHALANKTTHREGNAFKGLRRDGLFSRY